MHLLSFQDRIKSYSHLQGRREGGKFAPSEQQQPHPCTRLRGCVALRVRWRLDTPGSSLLALSFSWMKLSDRPVAPWAPPAAKEQTHRRLGCICVLPVNTVPFGRRGAMCSRAVSPFGTSSPLKGTAGSRGRYQSRTWPHLTLSHMPPIPSLQRLPLPCVWHSLQTSSPEGITPQRAGWLPQEGWEPCQLMAWHSYRWREAWD